MVILRQVEDSHQLPSNGLGLLESLREEDHFSNLLVVRFGHGHRTEELFQVVGQFLSTAVTLASWVHSDEYTSIGVQINL